SLEGHSLRCQSVQRKSRSRRRPGCTDKSRLCRHDLRDHQLKYGYFFEILGWSFSEMHVTTAIAFTAGFLAVAAVPALADCPADLAKVERAAQSRSLQDVEALVRKIDASNTCEPWEQDKAN